MRMIVRDDLPSHLPMLSRRDLDVVPLSELSEDLQAGPVEDEQCLERVATDLVFCRPYDLEQVVAGESSASGPGRFAGPGRLVGRGHPAGADSRASGS